MEIHLCVVIVCSTNDLSVRMLDVTQLRPVVTAPAARYTVIEFHSKSSPVPRGIVVEAVTLQGDAA